MTLLVSYFRLDDGYGNAAGLCVMAMDITERYRMRRSAVSWPNPPTS